MRSIVFICALAAALGIPAFIYLHAHQVREGLDELVQTRALRSLASCPLKSFATGPNADHLTWIAGYAGELRPGVPMTLLILRFASGAVSPQGLPIYTNVAGIYLPKLTAAEQWLTDWQARAARSSGEILVARQAEEGGAVVVFRDVATRKSIERHLAEVERSLPAR